METKRTPTWRGPQFSEINIYIYIYMHICIYIYIYASKKNTHPHYDIGDLREAGRQMPGIRAGFERRASQVLKLPMDNGTVMSVHLGSNFERLVSGL